MNFLNQFFGNLKEITPSSIAFLFAIILGSFLIFIVSAKYKKRKFNTRILVYASISIALSFILSYITLYKWPYGGSVTLCSMLPIMVFSYVFGPIYGVMTGFVFSLLQLVQGAYIVHPAQLLIDYTFAFSALGLTGLSRNNFHIGILIGGGARLFFHFLAGVIFFASYAPAGVSPIIYSLVVNLSVTGTDVLLCFIVSFIPAVNNAVNKFKTSVNLNK